ncbi:MAG: beta-ketoacyl synthase N-terminal-like domain-containing protein [bacterium]
MSVDPSSDLDIAIVGMAGRFPGAPSVAALWRNLRSGVESIRDLSDAELRAAGADDALLADPLLVRRAADLAGVDLFDAALFGFTPREAELTDPQFRVFLEDAWTALEDAGRLTDRHDLRVGVFAGGSASTYFENFVLENPRAARAVGAFQTALGNERDYLATQVSYRLDLRGPSFVVQTACSTSLVAVHLAAQSLLNRECDVALAGGVSISVPQTAGYLYAEGDIASPDGRCRAFDAAAAGVVKGNGSGVVVLRRLADALADGDPVRAVLKGSAVNNDGSVKVGFTAPSVEGQAVVIAEALAVADVDPATIDYVEAHGTGTPLGDPVEVAALARAFGSRRPGARRCALGSIKTNVGHLDAAAGVTGLLKAVLALEHREIPPSLHFERPNPKLDLETSGFFVNTELRPWTADGHPRRAGVSSFGIGGTNAHAILEEAPEATPSAPATRPQVLVLSAATEGALAAASEALAARLETEGAPELADAAYTLQVGRKRLPWRRGVVAEDRAAAAVALRESGRVAATRHDERRDAGVVFLFPGQGAQHAGMARSLAREEKVFREMLDRCAEILQPHLGLDLRDLVLAEPDDAAADERLRQTALTQPALFAVEYSLATLWGAWGVRPAAMAGHSIGEYVAACLAGVMSLEDALALVAERGRLMGSLPPGAMLAVHLPEAELIERLKRYPELSLAVINGPSAGVAAGPEEAIARLSSEVAPAGIACRRLRTSHAFHSAMMDPILEEFEARVRRVRLHPPEIPFLSNTSGAWITAEEAVDPGYWARHLRRTVRFADNVRTLVADASRVLLEVGPGATLTSLVRSAAGAAIASLPSRAGDDDHRSVLRALGQLWCAGADVDWSAHHDAARRRVPLPTYPFERQRYWIDADPAPRGDTPLGAAESGKNPDLAEWFWVPLWRRTRAVAAARLDAEPAWIVLDDGSAFARALAKRAAERGARLFTIRPSRASDVRREGDAFAIDPTRADHWAELLRRLAEEGVIPRRIVHLWCADAEADDPLDRGFHALLHLLRAIGQGGETDDLRLVAVTRGLFDVTGEAVRGPERAAMIGICRVAPQEYAGLSCRLVDVAAGDDEHGARHVEMELDVTDREPVTAWRGGHRWVPSHERARLDPPRHSPAPVHAGGAYLFTGGVGPLEVAVAKRLVAEGARAVGFLQAAPRDPAALHTLQTLRGESVDVLSWETSPDDASEAVAAMRARFGRVDAVFHTAGEIGGGMIQLKERDAAERVLRPRLRARQLAELLRDGEELVLFSSAISATGVFGQVDYCGASAFLDAFAAARRSVPGPRVRVLSFGMSLWDRWQDAEGSSALVEQLREIQREIGITVDEGVDALWRALGQDEPQLVVSTQNLDELIAQSRNASVSDFLQGVPGDASSSNGARAGGGGALESETEERVASLWSELLGIGSIGRTDSFFDLGGNSLLAIQLASRLRKTFDIELPIATLFESPDLAALAAAVTRAADERRSADEVAKLLEEIEALPEDEVRAQLRRDVDAKADE